LVRLLPLSGGGASLEFDEADLPAVRAAIAELFGPMRRKWFALAAEVTFGGESFAFQNEWSDPCLISRSPRGAEMLATLAARLT